MIRSLSVNNFTILSGEHRFDFAPRLDVVIGENASGKSHLLKLAYTLAAISHEAAAVRPEAKEFGRMVGRKLLRVFRPGSLGRLVHHGAQECRVAVDFGEAACDYAFGFSARSRSDVKLSKSPGAFLSTPAVFLPSREILSIWPGFAQLYQHHDLGFDATYFDLARALEAAPLGEAELEPFHTLLRRLEQLIGGRLRLEGGRFLLESRRGGKLEIDLSAEGIRRLATLYRLIQNGTIREGSLLFWDEPETNLNPKLIRPVAGILTELARRGVQIVLATHSLFLLRELEILSQEQRYASVPRRYITFSLKGGTVTAVQGDRIEEVEPIVSLEESLEQSDRYLEME